MNMGWIMRLHSMGMEFLRRTRTSYSHRAFTTCAVSSLGKFEELDERPPALLLTAARKSLGSC
jgi:hypothetical protein